jgi:hypothetical protein
VVSTVLTLIVIPAVYGPKGWRLAASRQPLPALGICALRPISEQLAEYCPMTIDAT